MPPRKSNIPQATATEEGGTPTKEREGGINIEDLSLPRTMVQRLAKGVLPPNTSLHKDAVLALSKGATVFINYLAQAAHESNQSSKSYRTIPPGAVLEALHDLEFENFVPRVDAELRKFNEVQTGKRNEYRRKVKEEKTGRKGEGEGEAGADSTPSGAEGGGEERAAKRVRRSEGGEEVMTMSPEVGDGSEQLREQLGQHDGDEEEEDEEFDAPDEAEEGAEGESSMYNLRQGKEEDEDEGDDDEEEDEDEYPDEGRRLSSVEREAFALEHQDDPGSASGSGSGSSSGEESD
ncbi:hypothetical protein N7G274_003830 [Stereocaulon virgatum]|uniref:DNA polymerase epsilon subunit D n=1 Tax=Stereocaulon virgatum TaxID=373712 RepID=A0ABR4AJC1_9LECA